MLQLHMAKTLLLDQALMLMAGAALGLLFREVSTIVESRETMLLYYIEMSVQAG